MDKRVKDSQSTLREHLLVIQTQTGEMPEELNNPEPNPAVLYLLGYFYELALSRQSGMTLCPITYQEIAAWQGLFHRVLSHWEIQVIKQLDMVFINVHNAES